MVQTERRSRRYASKPERYHVQAQLSNSFTDQLLDSLCATREDKTVVKSQISSSSQGAGNSRAARR